MFYVIIGGILAYEQYSTYKDADRNPYLYHNILEEVDGCYYKEYSGVYTLNDKAGGKIKIEPQVVKIEKLSQDEAEPYYITYNDYDIMCSDSEVKIIFLPMLYEYVLGLFSEKLIIYI